jgi:hypothetical protein
MNKKGTEERLYFWVFYFVVLIIILLGLFNYVNNLADKTTFNQDYLVRDIALVLNAVYASPGDIEVKYSVPENDFIFIIENGLVTIKEEGDVLNKRSYSYQEDNYVESNLDDVELKSPKVILFSKKEGILNVKKISEWNDE